MRATRDALKTTNGTGSARLRPTGNATRKAATTFALVLLLAGISTGLRVLRTPRMMRMMAIWRAPIQTETPAMSKAEAAKELAAFRRDPAHHKGMRPIPPSQ